MWTGICADPYCPNRSEVERLKAENAQLLQQIQMLQKNLELSQGQAAASRAIGRVVIGPAPQR